MTTYIMSVICHLNCSNANKHARCISAQLKTACAEAEAEPIEIASE